MSVKTGHFSHVFHMVFHIHTPSSVHVHRIEIPYRAFSEQFGPRILSLESVDYFRTTDHFSGREKKRIILVSKTSRFTGKSGSRIEESGIEDRLKRT